MVGLRQRPLGLFNVYLGVIPGDHSTPFFNVILWGQGVPAAMAFLSVLLVSPADCPHDHFGVKKATKIYLNLGSKSGKSDLEKGSKKQIYCLIILGLNFNLVWEPSDPHFGSKN